MKMSFSALDIAHGMIADHVQPGDICIDATAGRGRDTLFLCSLVGEHGRVTAFDIQSDAVDSTNTLLAQEGYSDIGRAVLDSHANIDSYEQPGTVSCVVYNFGWLPGGDHNVFTLPDSSIESLNKALELLRPGGMIAMCIYYGKQNGFAERDRLLEFLEGLDHRKYSSYVGSFVNRPNCPPITAFILKDK